MSTLKNITITGASGRLGSFVVQKLIASHKFNVRILKRAGSAPKFDADVQVVDADFDNVESLKTAFKGQDAIVSLVGDAGVLSQKNMVDAAIAAGVKRFLPSNFGSNMANPKSRKLPVFGRKVAVEDYLIEKSKTTNITYSFVYVGGFTDFVIQNGVIMDFSNYTPIIYNDGESRFSTTSMPTVGDAVVGVLSYPEATRNRPIYVSETILSQNQLLSLAKNLVPDKAWKPIYVDLDSVTDEAVERFARGVHDLPTVLPIILKSIVDPTYGPLFSENDNRLLGIKERDE